LISNSTTAPEGICNACRNAQTARRIGQPATSKPEPLKFENIADLSNLKDPFARSGNENAAFHDVKRSPS
jgi:hypothetical protein